MKETVVEYDVSGDFEFPMVLLLLHKQVTNNEKNKKMKRHKKATYLVGTVVGPGVVLLVVQV